MTDLAAIPQLKAQGLMRKTTGHEVSTCGYTLNGTLRHLLEHFDPKLHESKWCSLDCLTRFYGRRATENERKESRSHARLAFRSALDKYGLFIIFDEDKNGVKAVKLFENHEPHDREMAGTQLARMRSRKELSQKRYEQATQLVLALSLPVPEGDTQPEAEQVV